MMAQVKSIKRYIERDFPLLELSIQRPAINLTQKS